MRDQPPHGGCINCGAPVRTRKLGAWLCASCATAERTSYRAMASRHPLHLRPSTANPSQTFDPDCDACRHNTEVTS